MAEHVIHIPNWHPTRLNQLMGMHYMDATRRKRSDGQMMAIYAYKAAIPKANGKRRVLINVGITKGREPDPDAYYKSVHDGLVSTGYLVDDSSKWCELTPATFTRSKHKFTKITLIDVGAA